MNEIDKSNALEEVVVISYMTIFIQNLWNYYNKINIC